jgi:L-histidine N-alpha-methyltransferase
MARRTVSGELRSRFELVNGVQSRSRRATMAREVRAGLTTAPRTIPPKYFYDETGSRLFDEICGLPEYYLTRSESELLKDHSRSLVAAADARSLVEIGSGMARKTGALLGAICDRAASPVYVTFDIAPDAIRESARSMLMAFPKLRVRGIVGDFAHESAKLAAGVTASEGPHLFAFLGSTIGNLDESQAPALLRTIASVMTEKDRFLLGVDLVKAPAVLHAAYNDSRGVTAAFNLNVLRVLKRELDGDFDETAFEHVARYEAKRERIEMYLVATRRQALALRAADLRVELEAGEPILTEISRKFTRASVQRTLGEGNLAMLEWAPARDGSFALCLAERA